MCFSASASFVTAGITGAVGLFALTRSHERRERPLAAIPLFFAVQQSIEGLLWLGLAGAPEGSASSALTLAFLLFAEVFWPVYAPAAVWLIEPDRRRRLLMACCLLAGVAVAAFFLWWITGHPHRAIILDGHIVYVTEDRRTDTIGIAYVAATALPFLLSSLRGIMLLGAVILTGMVTAYVFYWDAFVSVWCFFAAAASVAILFHFERSRRSRSRTAEA